MKIDMHVHSKSSHRPSQWILQKINCPESFSEPLMIYRSAREKGLSHVTITDHNKITGALEIAHLPNVFISEEITAYFPEDQCKIHVLAYDINESQHQDIQKIRASIYELVGYLQDQNIFHAVAHPLYAVNDRLTPAHFEKMLLLFKVFELNGARSDELNQCLKKTLVSLTPKTIYWLADKHRLEPSWARPWEKAMIGGSDDHSSLNIGRTYTAVEDADTIDGFFKAVLKKRAAVCSRPVSPKTLAHNLYGIAYQYYNHKFNLDRYWGKDLLISFLNRILQDNRGDRPDPENRLYVLSKYRQSPKKKNRMPDSLKNLIRKETRDLILQDASLLELVKGHFDDRTNPEDQWFDFVNRALNNVALHLGNKILAHLSGADVFQIFKSMGSVGGLYMLLAPYFISFTQFAKDKRQEKEILESLPVHTDRDRQDAPKTKIAHFTDTFDEVNGVALTLKQQLLEARKNDFDYTIVICDEKYDRSQEGVCAFKPIGTVRLPEYPELIIQFPPILEILDYCYRENITQIISATPGPMGIAAWIAAKTLKIKISGTYHTALPQYIQMLTGDDMIADISWKFILWYYDQMDVIQVPSESTKAELVAKGISAAKIDLMNRGIDIARFHPGFKNGILAKRWAIPDDAVKLLYVGRISKEKNLKLLADVFSSLCRIPIKTHLIVTGEGPYLKKMEESLKGMPCTFTGYLHGDDLASVYASSDLFVFPSTTDTFGNVVLEAQASGIPLIVTDKGGPCENILPETTGLVAADDHDGFLEKILTLANDPGRRRKMGLSARKYMESRSFKEAFIDSWQGLADFQAPVKRTGTRVT